ncbi:putative transposase, partial [Breznakia sp. PFB2-30]
FFSSSSFQSSLEKASSSVNELNELLKPMLPVLKKALNKQKSKQEKMIPYADFMVEELPPIIKAKEIEPVQLSFTDIYQQIADEGKELTPVRNRPTLAYKGCCPHCGAPNEYLYLNNGKNQHKCKACKKTFTPKITPRDTAGIYCPHCKCKLDMRHDRSGYLVYSCINKKCSHYKDNRKLKREGKAEHLKISSGGYRLRYTYREFKFDMNTLADASINLETKVNLNKIHYDQQVLGLALTYYINYGLSSRKTSLILQEVHGLRISHQTIINYAQSVAKLVQPMVDYYPYELTSTITADETYVKVQGKNNYVFFFSDPTKKIISSYRIFETRDAKCACISTYNTLLKYRDNDGNIKPPKDLTFVTDGNPIYNAAQLYFQQHDLPYDLIQVIGVSNKDTISKANRPFKQIEERLNRTFKQNYHGTNGYHSLICANSYMVCYVAFFNFLRKHSSLGYKTPVDDNLFGGAELMPDKWLKLIELSSQYQIH